MPAIALQLSISLRDGRCVEPSFNKLPVNVRLIPEPIDAPTLARAINDCGRAIVLRGVSAAGESRCENTEPHWAQPVCLSDSANQARVFAMRQHDNHGLSLTPVTRRARLHLTFSSRSSPAPSRDRLRIPSYNLCSKGTPTCLRK